MPTCSERRPRLRAWLLLGSLLVLAPARPGSAEVAGHVLETRVFEVRHRPLVEAYQLVWPLLSDRADVRVNRTSRVLEVRDERWRLADVQAALAAFDVPLREVRLALKLIKGERQEAPGRLADAALGVPRDVRELLGFNSFETLGSGDVTVKEGKDAVLLLDPAGQYRVRLALGSVDVREGTIRVESLALERKLLGQGGEPVYRLVFKLQDRLKNGKPQIMCATPGAADRRALFLLMTGTVN